MKGHVPFGSTSQLSAFFRYAVGTEYQHVVIHSCLVGGDVCFVVYSIFVFCSRWIHSYYYSYVL